MSLPVQLVLSQAQIFTNDVIAGEGWSNPLLLSDVLEFIFGDRLTPFARKQHERGKAVESIVKPGWVHLGRDKDDLQSQRSTLFVRTRNTFLQHAKNGFEYMTFATYNVKKRKSWERRRANISSVRAFVIDIDTKKWPLSAITEHAEAYELPPSFVNETPRGYHLWYVLDQEFVGPHERNGSLTKVGHLYNDLNRFLIDIFEKAFPGAASGTDRLIGAERYIRIPRNIVHFTFQSYSIQYLCRKKKELFKLHSQKTNRKLSVRSVIPHHVAMADPAWRALLSMQPVPGKRRYTAFTISLFCRSIGYSEDKTLATLKSWYDGLANKENFKWPEVERTMQRAFSGRYKGPNFDWVKKLTGIRPKFFFGQKSRTNKSLNHWENQFLQLLQSKGGQWTVSNRDLCAAIDLSSRAMLDKMIESLIEKGLIRKTVSGHGRSAQTVYFLMPSTPNPDPDEDPERKDNVVSLELFRSKNSGFFAGKNDPFSYMPLLRFIRDGGRELPSLPPPGPFDSS